MTKCRYCDNDAVVRGRCRSCYGRAYRDGLRVAKRDKPPRPVCSLCGEPGHAKGLCAKHYQAAYYAKRCPPCPGYREHDWRDGFCARCGAERVR